MSRATKCIDRIQNATRANVGQLWRLPKTPLTALENTVPVTADDKMTVPVDNLLFWASRCIRRSLKLARMAAEWEGHPGYEELLAKEDEFVLAYRIVLRARAAEIVQLCESIGLTGCTVEVVRQKPFEIALAITNLLYGDIDEDSQATDR